MGDQMSSYKRRIVFLLPEQAKPFFELTKKLIEIYGSLHNTSKKIGVSNTVLNDIMNNQKITDKQAKKILEAYKQSKEIK